MVDPLKNTKEILEQEVYDFVDFSFKRKLKIDHSLSSYDLFHGDVHTSMLNCIHTSENNVHNLNPSCKSNIVKSDPSLRVGHSRPATSHNYSYSKWRHGVSKKMIEKQNLKEEISIMFQEAYNNYKEYAFPMDELNPISCSGRNTWGNYSLTLIDSLDSLVIVKKDYSYFLQELFWTLHHVNFNQDVNISVFETNIRIIGGLLSSYILLRERNSIYKSIYHNSIEDIDIWIEELKDICRKTCNQFNNRCNDEILNSSPSTSTRYQTKCDIQLSQYFYANPDQPIEIMREDVLNIMMCQTLDRIVDIADRLLPAFETKTHLPFGAINLKYGVSKNESLLTATAAAGTNLIEFGLLSSFTNNPKYLRAARNALHALFSSRHPQTGLLGNHVNIANRLWVHRESGIGGLVDSFFEYLMKGWMLFGEPEYLDMFEILNESIRKFIYKSPWYIDADMNTGSSLWPIYSSLQSFWPGTQSSIGQLELARETMNAFHSVWRKYGAVPEAYNIATGGLLENQRGYPLRPELAESAYHLYRATGDPLYQKIGKDILRSLQYNTRVKCGYANVKDVQSLELENKMESFFIAETLKYLYLLFDEENVVNQYPHTFNTEAHPIPLVYYHTHSHFIEFQSDALSRDAILLKRRKKFSNYQCPVQPFFSGARIGKNDIVHPNIRMR